MTSAPPAEIATLLPIPHKLLVPVDFSEPSEAALDYAIALADKLDAAITVLTVDNIAALYPAGLGAPLASIDQIVAGSKAALARLASSRRASGRIAETLHRTGDPREIIDELARQLRVDLIVMGTHGRRGFERLLIGSVAESIVRTAPCPVLTIRLPM